jgi:hypothetical protein
MTRNARLLAAAKQASTNLPHSYREMIDCLLMLTGPRRDGTRPMLRLV